MWSLVNFLGASFSGTVGKACQRSAGAKWALFEGAEARAEQAHGFFPKLACVMVPEQEVRRKAYFFLPQARAGRRHR